MFYKNKKYNRKWIWLLLTVNEWHTESLFQAVALDPNFLDAYINLGNVLKEARIFDRYGLLCCICMVTTWYDSGLFNYYCKPSFFELQYIYVRYMNFLGFLILIFVNCTLFLFWINEKYSLSMGLQINSRIAKYKWKILHIMIEFIWCLTYEWFLFQSCGCLSASPEPKSEPRGRPWEPGLCLLWTRVGIHSTFTLQQYLVPSSTAFKHLCIFVSDW